MKRKGLDGGDEMLILEYENINTCLREREMAFGVEWGGSLAPSVKSYIFDRGRFRWAHLFAKCERERFGHMDVVSSTITVWGFDRDNV